MRWEARNLDGQPSGRTESPVPDSTYVVGTSKSRDSQYLNERMPECQNCGSFVTEAYVRVFTPDEVSQPRVCPNCEDKIRDGAEVREARSTRRS